LDRDEVDTQPIKAHPIIFAANKPQESPSKDVKPQREAAPVTAAANTAVKDRIAMA